MARDIAVESKDTQDELLDRISRDDYMMYAVQECYYAIKLILTEVLDDAGRMWYVTAVILKCMVPCFHYIMSFIFDILTLCCYSFAIVAVVPGLKGYMMILMPVSQKGVFLWTFD